MPASPLRSPRESPALAGDERTRGQMLAFGRLVELAKLRSLGLFRRSLSRGSTGDLEGMLPLQCSHTRVRGDRRIAGYRPRPLHGRSFGREGPRWIQNVQPPGSALKETIRGASRPGRTGIAERRGVDNLNRVVFARDPPTSHTVSCFSLALSIPRRMSGSACGRRICRAVDERSARRKIASHANRAPNSRRQTLR